MRDMSRSSKYRAQDLAADIGVARRVIRHDALRGRDDGDAEPVVDARQAVDRDVDAASGLRHPGDLADHRLAVEVLQLDVELGAAVLLHRGVAADVALAL